jgi:hypothetical protein
MEPVRVPQHLDLEDVLAFGLGAVDLLWLGGGLVLAWWLWLNVAGPAPVRAVVAVIPAITGVVLGVARNGDISARSLVVAIIGYGLRPRLRLYEGDA